MATGDGPTDRKNIVLVSSADAPLPPEPIHPPSLEDEASVLDADIQVRINGHDHTPDAPEWLAELPPLESYARSVQLPIPGDDEDAQQLRLERLAFSSVGELLQRPYPTWTVLDLVPERGLMVVYGGPGSGKTFFMLDMGIAISRGRKWYGRRVKAGAVLYIAAEGSLRTRLEAYMAHNGIAGADLSGFGVLESSVNLLDRDADLAELMASIARASEQMGMPVRLIVIDTLARTMPGGNENASEDMGAVIDSAGRIERAFNCVVAFVHHSGKDDTKGSRGHSSLKGATDVEISIKRDGDVRQAVAEKVRDGSDGDVLLTFKLQSVDLHPRHRFDPAAEPEEMIRSCVVVPCAQENFTMQKSAMPRSEIAGAIIQKVLSQASGQKKGQIIEELSQVWNKESVRKTIYRMVRDQYLTEMAGIITKGPALNAAQNKQ